VYISCRPHVDVHKGEGVWLMWTHVDRREGGQKSDFCVDVINEWPLSRIVERVVLKKERPLKQKALKQGLNEIDLVCNKR